LTCFVIQMIVFCMSTASTTLQVRMPRALRDGAASVLEEMGLDLPTAVRLYLTKVAKTRRIPFALEAEPAAEAVEVDRSTQARMDRIAKAWKVTKRGK
jgi:DNA-damage-inducible protein J